MFGRRFLIPFALALCVAGCSDDVSGPSAPTVLAPLAQTVAGPQIHILQQRSSAPKLQAYKVSFWAYQGKPTTITVAYKPAAGRSAGAPFLLFYVPRNGLVAGGGGSILDRGDSVAITLTIDPLAFSVDFQPSGVLFSERSPALLALYYENANPDLNGNGVVDGYDRKLEAQLAIWTSTSTTSGWSKLLSANDTTRTVVASPLAHFSQYAVSW